MTARPAYPLDAWLDDLRLCIKVDGMTPTAAAARLGISRATTYRLIAQAKTERVW